MWPKNYNYIKEGENIKKRFKTSPKLKKWLLVITIFIVSLITSFVFVFKFLVSKIKIDDSTVVKYLISNGANNSIENFDLTNFLNIKSPNFLLNYALNINSPDDKLAIMDEDENKETSVNGDYIEDPSTNTSNNPIIYIYNTHQTESYAVGYLAPYSITPTVLLASYILRERLNDLSLPAIVETSNVSDILNAYGWKYGYSYRVSRMLLEEAKKTNPTLTYYIDLHRDAGSHAKTTTKINDSAYAKVLFVVGLDHDNYEPNLKLANDLNALFNKYYPSLSRGVITKSGKGVNGIYNQDFDKNTFLIEVGGQYNTIDEVTNTINAFSDILFKYIKGESYEKETT